MPLNPRDSLHANNQHMLFCKPSFRKGMTSEEIINPGAEIQFRSLIIKKDLNILHQWVNEDYAKKFWQLQGPKEKLQSFYLSILKNPDAHSFIGLLDEELVCQVDVYRVSVSDLGKHIEFHPDDCGMHLLMAPLAAPITGLSKKVMGAFLQYYFSFEQAQHLYAEPDIHNNKACRLLEKSGFSFVRNIMLSDKAASLYLMTRKQFYAAH